jgi:hypothetical protein
LFLASNANDSVSLEQSVFGAFFSRVRNCFKGKDSNTTFEGAFINKFQSTVFEMTGWELDAPEHFVTSLFSYIQIYSDTWAFTESTVFFAGIFLTGVSVMLNLK